MSKRTDQTTTRLATRPRQDWDEAFRRMAAEGDDGLPDEPVATQWDAEEWQWRSGDSGASSITLAKSLET